MRDHGLGVTLRKSVAWLFRFVYRSAKYRIYRIDLGTLEPTVFGKEDLEYRFIEPTESLLIGQVEGLEEWLSGSVEQKLLRGSLCLVAIDSVTVAGFNLISFGQVHIPLIEDVRRFPAGTAWSEQITVRPEYRGRGIASKLRYKIFAELKSRGITRFYGGALALNTASLRLAQKVGFREIVEVHHQKCFGVRVRRYRRLRSN